MAQKGGTRQIAKEGSLSGELFLGDYDRTDRRGVWLDAVRHTLKNVEVILNDLVPLGRSTLKVESENSRFFSTRFKVNVVRFPPVDPG